MPGGLKRDCSNPNLDVTFASAYLGGSFYDREVRLHAPLAYHPGNQILGGQQPPGFDFFPDSSVESFFPQAVVAESPRSEAAVDWTRVA